MPPTNEPPSNDFLVYKLHAIADRTDNLDDRYILLKAAEALNQRQDNWSTPWLFLIIFFLFSNNPSSTFVDSLIKTLQHKTEVQDESPEMHSDE